MLELAIGLGAAVAGVLTVTLVFAGLLKRSGARGDAADRRADDSLVRERQATVDLAAAEERERILEHNTTELQKQISALKTSLQVTGAELASVKASHDDLVRTLAEHPGALPALVRDALDRLRAQVSAAAKTAPGSGDDGREARSLHGPDALEPPG